MKDIKIKATFDNSEKVIYFELSDLIFNMGHQCAEDVSLEEEIGKELAYLHDNFNNAIFEIVKND